jgi:hypothetical protein
MRPLRWVGVTVVLLLLLPWNAAAADPVGLGPGMDPYGHPRPPAAPGGVGSVPSGFWGLVGRWWPSAPSVPPRRAKVPGAHRVQ